MIPQSLVDDAIGPSILAIAMLDSVNELTDKDVSNISFFVIVGTPPGTVHVVLFPWTFIFVVLSFLGAFSCCDIVLEVSFEVAIFFEVESARSVLEIV